MDLHSLLNQGSSTLSLDDLTQLLNENDEKEKLNRISQATFDYNQSEVQSYSFFDLFIRVLTSVQHADDDEYSAQYAKSVITAALRQCINDLLQKFGLTWAVRFSAKLSLSTWKILKTQPETTILVYLYGLVLAVGKQPDISKEAWIDSLAYFIHASHPAVVLHIWLTCCAADEQTPDAYVAKHKMVTVLEQTLEQQKLDGEKNGLNVAVQRVITLLKEENVGYLIDHIDNQVGNALIRPSFTADEFAVAWMELDNMVNEAPSDFPYLLRKMKPDSPTPPKVNPLTKGLKGTPPDDYYERSERLKIGMDSWMNQVNCLTPSEFQRLLNALIRQYPTRKKTMVDWTLVTWAVYDPFHCHADLILDAVIGRLNGAKYDKLSAPFYAFEQLFNLDDEKIDGDHEAAYKIQTGAQVHLPRFCIRSDNALENGCLFILRKLTMQPSLATNQWKNDCLKVAPPEVTQQHIEWLLNELIHSSQPDQTNPLKSALLRVLQHPRVIAYSSYIIPLLLRTVDQELLAWLLTTTEASAIFIDYFSQGAQLSSKILISDLLETKSKRYMDALLAFLRRHLTDTSLNSNRSRVWFTHHFLESILALAASDPTGHTVASQLFRQFLRTADEYHWYFATALHPKNEDMLDFRSLNILRFHTVFPIRHIGLASVLQQMVNLPNTQSQEILIDRWFNLWVSPSVETGESRFTVPESWIIQCIGLYDQAPALMKRMMERLLDIGLRSQMTSGADDKHTFTQSMMDLVLLSDTPKPQIIFDLFQIHCEKLGCASTEEPETIRCIGYAFMELANEIDLEQRQSDPPAPPPSSLAPHHVPTTLPSPLKPLWRRKIRKRELRKMKQKASKEAATAAAAAAAVLIHAQPGPTEVRLKGLKVLVTRVLDFLVGLFDGSDQHSVCIVARQRLQQSMASWLLIYEPLRQLNSETCSEDIRQDVQTVIDACIDLLGATNPAMVQKIRRILYRP
ncbi:uncharacterized protein BYT42DRAFT_618452 [Radiomyces spectabilis]|uniref:uncharacterized protein n=1 Tax=Radiomyces spectabilis TaxID=64574 RepID=UPI002220E34A|nr:uncharacterized protein BYT42DRAFT_618452 [Radiomyces spectabilis]KAI8366010.1 hypothetical protein BYT42DRAFT_618452 [Radiomyces spectabilis]